MLKLFKCNHFLDFMFEQEIVIRSDGKRQLPIVLAADANFSIPFGLAILSLLETASPNTYYDVYVLDGGITDEVKSEVIKFKERFEFSITYYDVSEAVAGLPATCIFPPITYARFLVADLLPENVGSRIFYIDSDVLFCADLTPLYDMDMKGHPVAATQALNMTASDNRSYLKWLGLEYNIDFFESGNPYFHAGELLFDRKAWVEGGFSRKCVEMAQKKLPNNIKYYDQDFFNIVCRGNIANFPAKYCVIPQFEKRYYGDYEQMYEGLSLYSEAELSSVLEKPAIVHYAGVKPIVFRKPMYNGEASFFELWRRSPWKDRIPYFPRPILLMNPIRERARILSNEPDVPWNAVLSVVVHTDRLLEKGEIDSFIKTIDSLHEQTYPHIEILVVDSGGCSATVDLLNKYASKRILRWHTLRSQNRYNAYNHGLREARGAYVIFLPIGAVMGSKEFVEEAMKAFSLSENDVAAVSAKCRIGSDTHAAEIEPKIGISNYAMPAELGATIFRALKLKSCSGFAADDYTHASDYKLFVDLLSAGERISHVQGEIHMPYDLALQSKCYDDECESILRGLSPSYHNKDSDNIEVSVIVSHSAERGGLLITLENLISQTFSNIEIIVLSASSDELSCSAVRLIQERDSRVINVTCNEISGGSMTRNHGLSLARGRYVMFVRSGDILSPDYLEHMYKRVHAGNFDVVKSRACCMRHNLRICWYDDNRLIREKLSSSTILLNLFNEHSETALYRREFLTKAGAMFADIAGCDDDSLFLQRVAANLPVWRFSLIDEVQYHYRGSDVKIATLNDLVKIAQLRISHMLSIIGLNRDSEPLKELIEDILEKAIEFFPKCDSEETSIQASVAMLEKNIRGCCEVCTYYSPGPLAAALLASGGILSVFVSLVAAGKLVRIENSLGEKDGYSLHDREQLEHKLRYLELAYQMPKIMRKYRLTQAKALFSFGKRRARYREKMEELKKQIRLFRNMQI
ncbi:MAG: glycosyltransferase [Akkermansia sp.]|nr:glycosyltransferase [Akkermansia sp.]